MHNIQMLRRHVDDVDHFMHVVDVLLGTRFDSALQPASRHKTIRDQMIEDPTRQTARRLLARCVDGSVDRTLMYIANNLPASHPKKARRKFVRLVFSKDPCTLPVNKNQEAA